MKEQLEKLVEWFPDRFRFEDEFYDEHELFRTDEVCYDFWFDGSWNQLELPDPPKVEMALLNAALVDLIEGAKFSISVDFFDGGFEWQYLVEIHHGDYSSTQGKSKTSVTEALLDAVCAAAPVIKRRLEEVHATD